MNKDFSISIMMHPAREKYKKYLISHLGDVPISIDRKKGIWDTARRAWLTYDKNKKFHLVIQDDVILCDNFIKEVESLLKKEGDKYVYSLFYKYKNQDKNRLNIIKKGIQDGYMLWWKLQWGQAVIIPTKLIEEMIQYCDKLDFNADDERIRAFLKRKKIQVFYPLPSLVQHRNEEESLVGHRNNKFRQALRFIDDYKK